MKGKVLEYNIQNSAGVILADDSSRYSFEASQWRSLDVPPKKGLEVDFIVDGRVASELYALDNGSNVSSANLAKAVYISYLIGLFVPFVSLIGVIVAYVQRGSGPEWLDDNYRYAIRTFWIGLLYSLVSFILIFIFIGWLTLIATIVWIVLRSIRGLKAINEQRAPNNIEAWLFN